MKSTDEKNIRFSGIELLKIFSIFLICLSHVTQISKLFLNFEATSISILTLKIFSHFGQIANIIFIVCSSIYLVNNNKIKKEKVLKILLDSVIISTIIFLTFLICGKQFTTFEAIKQIFPDIFLNLSFIPCYIALYLLHPILNKMSNKLNKKNHLILIVAITAIFVLFGSIFDFSFGANLMSYIIIYVIVQYIKKYHNDFCNNKKKNLISFVLFSLIFILLTTGFNLLLTSQTHINCFVSMFLVPANISLVNIFSTYKFKNKVVNYLSSCSLFFYCFHENILIRSNLRPNIFKNLLNQSYLLPPPPSNQLVSVIIYAVLIYFVYFLISILYKLTLSKITDYLSKKISNVFDKIKNKG